MKKYFNSINDFFRGGGWRSPCSILGFAILSGWIFRSEIHVLISNILTSKEFAGKIGDGIATAFGVLLLAFKDQIFYKGDKKDDVDNK